MTAVSTPLDSSPEVYRRRWAILGVMSVSLVLVVMSVSGLNVALPTLVGDLGAEPQDHGLLLGRVEVLEKGLRRRVAVCPGATG